MGDISNPLPVGWGFLFKNADLPKNTAINFLRFSFLEI